MKAKKVCPRCHRLKIVRAGERYCDACLELRKREEARMKPYVESTVERLERDTVALKQLSDLRELASVPPERGGYHFSDWERGFIQAMSDLELSVYSQAQRDKIKEIWYAADLRGRASPDEKAKNLFSALSPERQAEQRARAAKVRLPWE